MLSNSKESRSRKGTLSQGLGALLIAIVAIMTARWLLFEPYLIPSGSMIPTFLINDHILVDKLHYGIRVPFTSRWLFRFRSPQRGEVVVFRSQDDPDFYLVKRVVAVGGDQVEYKSGELLVNGQPVASAGKEKLSSSLGAWEASDFNGPGELEDYLQVDENFGQGPYTTLLRKGVWHLDAPSQVVPEGQIFMMGDNRDNSHDSRYWGPVPIENVLGKALFVWLSCKRSAANVSFACWPGDVRWRRFFHAIH